MAMARSTRMSETWRSSFEIKKMAMAMAIGAVFMASLIGGTRGCHFPAIYNFGDSNSDTGGVSAALSALSSPYGETFPGIPFGRNSDGRLIIDFMTEKLGLPLLHAYLDSVDPNFRHGANFAATRSTIQPANGKLIDGGFNFFSLAVQLSQFEQFKNRTIKLYNQGTPIGNSLPRPEDFSKALYTLEIGQNDLHFELVTMKIEQVKASITNLTDQFILFVKQLYDDGARRFWIHNVSPMGCLPFFVVIYQQPGDADQNGCVKSYNEVVQEFNKQLKDKVSKLRTQLHDAKLILVDIYSAKYSLISEAKQHGFVDPLEYCCGKLRVVFCGATAVVNGTAVSGTACNDPSRFINWDSIHFTDAANRLIANRILDGSFSDPPIPLTQACS